MDRLVRLREIGESSLVEQDTRIAQIVAKLILDKRSEIVGYLRQFLSFADQGPRWIEWNSLVSALENQTTDAVCAIALSSESSCGLFLKDLSNDREMKHVDLSFAWESIKNFLTEDDIETMQLYGFWKNLAWSIERYSAIKKRLVDTGLDMETLTIF